MKMHSGILSPSHLFSAALLAAALFAAPPAKADITINGTSYSGAVNLSGANYTISGTGTTSNRLIVKENCTITFDNVSFPLSTGTTNAISVFPGKTVTLKLSGENTITLSGTKQTGISVPSTSTLNITNITDDAKLIVTATGTRNLAIGGQYCAGKCGTINIWGGAISASSGTYSAGIGSYKGSKTVNFTIDGMSLAEAVFSAIDNQTYTGAYITPEFTVTLDGKTLTEGEDYTVSYSNNRNASVSSTAASDTSSMAKITITGIGGYTGTAATYFNILPVSIDEVEISPVGSQVYAGGAAVTPEITATLNGNTLIKGTDYTLSYSNNYYVTTDSQKATLTVTGKNNITGSKTFEFDITCDHVYVETEIAPTLTEDGATVYTCEICGDSYSETIPKLEASLGCVFSSRIVKKGSYETVTMTKMAEGDSVASVTSSNKDILSCRELEENVYRLSGLSVGEVEITVVLESGLTHTHTVYVTKDGKLATNTIKLNKTKKTLKVGKTFTLKATVTPDITTDKLKFTSSNKRVATVGKTSGIVKAKRKGTAKIKAKSGSKTATCTVTVKKKK